MRQYAPNGERSRIIRRYENSPSYVESKFVNMVRGSFKHGAYESLQMGYMRPNTECSSYRTPVHNLYLCGASVYPGGMVLLGGGYNAKRGPKRPRPADMVEIVARARARGLAL